MKIQIKDDIIECSLYTEKATPEQLLEFPALPYICKGTFTVDNKEYGVEFRLPANEIDETSESCVKYYIKDIWMKQYYKDID